MIDPKNLCPTSGKELQYYIHETGTIECVDCVRKATQKQKRTHVTDIAMNLQDKF